MKKVLALVLMAMLVLSGAALAEDDGFYIGFSNQQRSEDFFITVADGLAAAAAENGIQFEESITDRDAVKMTQVVDTFMLKGVDLVIDFNVLAETGAEMAAKLATENIPMIPGQAQTCRPAWRAPPKCWQRSSACPRRTSFTSIAWRMIPRPLL